MSKRFARPSGRVAKEQGACLCFPTGREGGLAARLSAGRKAKAASTESASVGVSLEPELLVGSGFRVSGEMLSD